MSLRRRRLISEESDGTAEERPIRLAGEGELGTTVAYTPAAQAARNRAIHTLVPSGWLGISLWFVAGLLMVGICELLHLAGDSLATVIATEDVAALRLDAPRSVSHWFSATWLGLAAMTSLFIYALRRHRVDDYHGRYRVWLWAAAGCLLTSLGETTDLGRLARALYHWLAACSGVQSDALWGITVGSAAVILSLVVLYEVRKHLGVVALLFASATCIVASLAVEHGWPLTDLNVDVLMVARGCWLAGHVLLLTTLLLYVKAVQRAIESNAVVSERPKRTRVKAAPAKNEDAEAPKASLKLRTDLDPVHRSAAPKRSEPEEDEEADDEAPQHRHLSKSERRRMRRESRMAS